MPAACLEALRARFGDRFSESAAVREHHGRDESPYPVMAPDGVVFAHSTEEVAEIARLCNEHRVPLIPYGAGSSLEGHILAIQGGISLDLSQMNKGAGRQCRRPHRHGAGRRAAQAAQRRDPQHRAVLPHRSGRRRQPGRHGRHAPSGTNAVRYGTMRENVMSLTVVTADGRIVRTAGRARKSSAGYDLTRVFVGSEGTLGIITEVTVRLYPQPEAVSAAVCNFPRWTTPSRA